MKIIKYYHFFYLVLFVISKFLLALLVEMSKKRICTLRGDYEG
jgi:hypothetical protein